jgi:hypothetical protein
MQRLRPLILLLAALAALALTAAPALAEYPLATPGAFATDITVGPDGALWIAEENVGQVARLDIGFDPPVEAHATTFSGKVDRSVNPVVATFSDADPNARARDYSVTISCGDGQTSAGTVTRAGDGSFVVRGRHVYFRKGTRKVVVSA